MLRRAFIAGTLSFFGPPLPAEAQQPAINRIGYLGGSDAPGVSDLVAAFRQGLRDLGYGEGKNIVIEYRWAEGRSERLPDLAAELVRLKLDVIVAGGEAAALAANKATRTIPIVTVVGAAASLVESGLVASLARPGGNVTGLSTTAGSEIVGKQLELLKEAVPKISRVAVLWSSPRPEHPSSSVREAEVPARALALRLQLREVRGPDEFDTAFAAMTWERAAALLVLADSMLLAHRSRLADLAAKNRLPAMYGMKEFAEAGGLMAYAASLRDVLRRAAAFVDKILKGAKPGDLPVEQPTKFELVVNLKTAKALGLTIPPSVLARADEVIE